MDLEPHSCSRHGDEYLFSAFVAGYGVGMTAPRLELSLENLAHMCRQLHAAAVYEAELSKSLAGMAEQCVASSVLLRSYNNILAQLQSQFSDPFVAGIPTCNESIEAIRLPMLTAQVLGAVLALAAPQLTPAAVTSAWDDKVDADYDAL